MLNQHGDSGGVTCADCYFRQELLCALSTERVCPTFRATVGSAPARPRQAQLMPVPMLVGAGAGGAGQWPAPAIAARLQPTAAASPDGAGPCAAQPVSAPPAVQLRDAIRSRARAAAAETSEPVFGTTSEEANFSVRDAGNEPGDDIVTAREAADPRPALRAAASRMDFANEVVIEVIEPSIQSSVGTDVGGRALPAAGRRDQSRAERIAQRIAQRYPNALHC